MDLPGSAIVSIGSQPEMNQHQPDDAAKSTTPASVSGQKRNAENLTSDASSMEIPEPTNVTSSSGHTEVDHLRDLLDDMDPKDLTEQQKVERRERNREHAKRSRLRKRFLLESLQEQIHGLEEQLENLKSALRTELPTKADEIITTVCGDKNKYTPLPMPSGFGPVKTLMEPDFRLSKYSKIRFCLFEKSHPIGLCHKY
jgi:Basic region leucine zipper